MENEYLVVSTTTSSAEEAQQIASVLVEQRLAACVQVTGPVQSTYRWQGQVEQAQEWMCHIKTSVVRYPAVEAAIQEIHSYEQPEIIAVPILFGAYGYLQWMRQEIGQAQVHS